MRKLTKEVKEYKLCCDSCGYPFDEDSDVNNILVFKYEDTNYHHGGPETSEVKFDICNECKSEIKTLERASKTPHDLYVLVNRMLKHAHSSWISAPYEYFYKDPVIVKNPEVVTIDYEK